MGTKSILGITSPVNAVSLTSDITSTANLMMFVEPTNGVSKDLVHTLMIMYSSRKSLFNTWCSVYCGYTNSDDNDTCDIIYLSYCFEEEEETINNTQ